MVRAMKVLIAGAGSEVGLALIERLLADGHEVTGLTRSPDRGRAIRAAGATLIMCDILLERQLLDAAERVGPEAIVHLLSEPPADLDAADAAEQLAPVNMLRRDGTRNLVAAARATGAERVIGQSVAFAYAPEGDWIKDEGAPLARTAGSVAGEAVAAVEDLERQLRDAGGVILRFGHLYGPGTPFGGKGHYAELARKRQLILPGAAEGRWSFVHVRDAAAAAAQALEADASGVYNIVDDEPAPAADWIPVYADAVGAKRPRKLPEALGARMIGPILYEALTRQRGASNAKARAELEWTPSLASWRPGFAQAITAENRERWRWAR